MKNRINWFIACIITVTLLLCVAGCQDFLIQGTPGNTIININLDLSKLIKNARNDESQINGYVLKLFVYDAQNYKDGDREIENLPLITQTSNKVDVNGIVKASLEVEIDKTVIFVGKLFTLNEDNVESDKPLYAGKSEAFKVQPKDNKVHLVLSREKSEIGFEIELAETHTHTFAEEWLTSLTHHWKGTTCGHNDVMAEFTEHSFSNWTTTKEPTEEDSGSKERTCSVCNYKEVVEIANLSHTHTFAEEWSTSLTHHWKGTTCGHNDVMADFTEHSFSDWTTTQQPTEEVAGSKERTCSVCNYKEVVEIANLSHTHTFAEEWSTSLTHHWKGTTCGHNDVMAEFTEHSFSDWTTTQQPTEEDAGSKERTCEECNYKEVVEIANLSHTHTFADSWSTSLTHHWKGTTCGHNGVMAEFTEHSFGVWEITKEPTEEDSGSQKRTCSVCNYKEVVEIANLSHTHTFADSWSTSLTHHWKGTTCGHNDVMADFTEHSFSDWTTILLPTEEVAGSKERTCEECNYKEVVEIANLSHTHTFAEEWSTSLSHHWKGTTCGHNDVMADFTEHSFGVWEIKKEPTEQDSGSKERTCEECNYKEVVEIEKLAHTHKFASDWTYDGTYHWKASICDHDVTEGKVVHTFGNWTTTKEPTEETEGSQKRTCSVCNYEDTAVIEKLAHTHTFADSWSTSLTHHWKAATCEHTDIVSDFREHTFGEWQRKKEPEIGVDGTKERYCTDCNYNEIDVIAKIPENFVFVQGDTITGASPIWLEPINDDYKGVFIDGRTVTLSDFYMGKYEVTQEEYASVMAGQKVMVNGTEYELESNPNYCTADSARYTLFDGDEQGKRPVEGVTWYDVVWYCNALSVKEGLSPAYNIEVTKVEIVGGKTGYYIYEADVKLNDNATGYRLPTVAEWEYAARGGDTEADDWNYVFSGADKVNGTTYDAKINSGLDSVGWYCYNNITGETGDSDVTTDVSGKGTHQVGKKEPNRLRIYDMSGNVREWCYDWKGDVNTGTESDPTGASSGTSRVSRGGGWNYYAYGTTVTSPSNFNPNNRDSTIGFRVVRPQF